MDHEVNQTSHIDYTVNDVVPLGQDSYLAYHPRDLPANLAHWIKCQFNNCVNNDPGYTNHKLTHFFSGKIDLEDLDMHVASFSLSFRISY